MNVDTGKLAWHFQYTPNDSWDYDEVGVHMLYDTTHQRPKPQGRRPFRAQRFLLLAGPHQRRIPHGRPDVNDLNWTKGLNPKTGKPLDYDPKLDVQIYNPAARALRGDGLSGPARPGMAASRTSRPPTTP